MKQAIDFFLKYYPTYKNDILNVEQIKQGFSNLVFKLTTTKSEVFKVRIACHNNLISRSNELTILSLIPDSNLLIYEKESGHAIYKWIRGKTISSEELTEENLKKIYQLASCFYKTEIPEKINILCHNHFDEKKRSENKISVSMTLLYTALINKHQNLPMVLTHNDISLKNLIISEDKKNIYLIDYEWGRINTVYWDMGNFIREAQLEKDKIEVLAEIAKLNFSILIDFVFIATYYSLQLSYAFPERDTLIEYRKKLNKQLLIYYGWIKKN